MKIHKYYLPSLKQRLEELERIHNVKININYITEDDYVLVNTQLEPLVINSHEFVAKIDHLPNGEVVGASYEAINKNHYNLPKCDHCNVNRHRNTTLVIRDKATGELKQIGTSCVDKYLGSEVLGKIIASFNFKKSLPDILTNFKERCTPVIKVKDVLASALHITDGGKYYAKASSLLPTWAEINVWAPKISRLAKEQAEEIIKIIKEAETTNSYFADLKAIVSNEYIRDKRNFTFKLLVSACTLLNKRQEAGENKHFGEIKQRYRNVEVEFISSIYLGEGEYGARMLHILIYEGVKLYWFTGNTNVQLGPAKVSFTIQKHNLYKQEPQTLITRLSFSKT